MNYILLHSKTITAAITATAILSGIARVFSYKVGHYMLLVVVAAYFIYRLFYFAATIARHKHLNKRNKQHFAIFIALLIVVVFNNFDLLDAPFISLFLLMVDYLISYQPISASNSASKSGGQ